MSTNKNIKTNWKMQDNDHPLFSPSMTNREIVGSMLHIMSPDIDLADEEAVFGMILDDYGDYARLLAAEMAGHRASAGSKVASDGLPHLN